MLVYSDDDYFTYSVVVNFNRSEEVEEEEEG